MGAHLARGVSRLRRGVVVATGMTLTGTLLVFGGTAAAAPSPNADQLRAKISKLMSQLDAISQQYDQSIVELNAASTQLNLLDRRLSRAQQNFDTMRTAVTQIASAAYEQGDGDSTVAMLASNDPQTVLDRADLLSHLSADRRTQMSAFIAAAQTLRTSQEQQQRAEAAIAAIKKAKAAERRHLEQLVAQNKTELNKLTAPSGGGSGSMGGGFVPTGGHATGSAATAVQFALSQLGAPYTWGGTGPYSAGYDCSGLVMQAWAAAGVQIPRTTYDQWASLPHVSSADIQPGDLMFYDGEGHVAMYVGGGKIVDAPQSGENVEELPASSSWYASNFDGAARP